MQKKNKHFIAIKNNILNFTVLAVSNFGNFFSLIFLIFMSRNLSDDDFSLNSALIGTISLISFLATFLTTYISKFVALNVKKKFLNTFFFNFLKISAYSVVILIMIFIFHEYIFIFFKFKDFKILFFCFSIFYFHVLLFYVDGFLLGNNRFIFHSGVFALLQFLKIVLLIIIVNFFYSRFAGVYSIFFSLLIVLIIIFLYFLLIETNKITDEIDLVINFSSKDFLPSVFIHFFILYFINIDIILSRNFFNSDTSSEYIIISSLSKIIFYFFGVLLPLVIPQTINSLKKKTNEFFFIFKVIFLIFFFYLFLIFFDLFFLKTILGKIFKRNNSLDFLFLYLSFTYGILSINSFLLKFFFSTKKVKLLLYTFVILIISMPFLNFITDPIHLASYIFVSLLLIFVFLIFNFINLKKKL